jgi:hypothetical protein
MLRIKSKLINEPHIVEINHNNDNIELTLTNGIQYDIGISQQRISPFQFIELTADELEELVVRLKRF